MSGRSLIHSKLGFTLQRFRLFGIALSLAADTRTSTPNSPHAAMFFAA